MDTIAIIRQNHALEHATIAVLLERLEVRVKMAGYAGLNGFYIMGNVPTITLEEAAYEGLKRLKAGEKDIAVSPMCGTNLAAAGLVPQWVRVRRGALWARHRLRVWVRGNLSGLPLV